LPLWIHPNSSATHSDGTPEEHHVEAKRDLATGQNHTNKIRGKDEQLVDGEKPAEDTEKNKCNTHQRSSNEVVYKPTSVRDCRRNKNNIKSIWTYESQWNCFLLSYAIGKEKK